MTVENVIRGNMDERCAHTPGCLRQRCRTERIHREGRNGLAFGLIDSGVSSCADYRCKAAAFKRFAHASGIRQV